MLRNLKDANGKPIKRNGSSCAPASPAGCARRASGAVTAASTAPGPSPSPASAASPAACCTSATTPSRALGDTQPARPQGRRQGAHLHDRQGHGPDPGAGRPDRASGGRHDDGAVLPDQRLRAGRAVHLRAAQGLPQHHGTTTATFTCRIPRSALDPANPPQARPSLYGHGLLGSPNEVNAGNVRSMANEHNFVFCATAWAGFSSEDLGNVVGGDQRLLAASTRSRTGCSRASSTSCCSDA